MPRVGEFPGALRDEPGNQDVGSQALATPVGGKLLSQPGQVLRAGMDRGEHGERVADRLDGGSVKVRSRDPGCRRMRAILVAAASLLPLAAAGLAHRVLRVSGPARLRARMRGPPGRIHAGEGDALRPIQRARVTSARKPGLLVFQRPRSGNSTDVVVAVCVPRISSMALASGVALPAVRP